MPVLPLILSLLLATVGAPDAGPVDRPGARAAAVLARWDERRATAWASADLAALHRLYVPGSRAGDADVAMLRAWHRRGLRVAGMRMQLLSVRVTDRSPGRMVLDVSDRLAGVVAVGDGGDGVRRKLPADLPSRHRVVLERWQGRWRVAAVS